MSENGIGLIPFLLLVAIAAALLGYSQVATVAFWGALSFALVGVVIIIVIVVLGAIWVIWG